MLKLPEVILRDLKVSSLTKICSGRHYRDTYTLTDNTGVEHILKTQPIGAYGSLAGERDRLIWLDGTLPSPRLQSYTADSGREYLLMSLVPGCPSLECCPQDGPISLGTILGKGLKRIHDMPRSICPFNDCSPTNNINQIKGNVRNRKQEIDMAIQVSFPDESLSDLLRFLENIVPSDDKLVVTHGDFGPAHIFVEDGKISGYIDLESLGISDPYYDIYYMVKSLTTYSSRNDAIDDFCTAYGIDSLDPKMMRFQKIVDVLLL